MIRIVNLHCKQKQSKSIQEKVSSRLRQKLCVIFRIIAQVNILYFIFVRLSDLINKLVQKRWTGIQIENKFKSFQKLSTSWLFANALSCHVL